jgi:four helix bundle protein
MNQSQPNQKKTLSTSFQYPKKEVKETKYWLILIDKSNLVSFNLSGLNKELNSIDRIISSIILTTKRKYDLKNN